MVKEDEAGRWEEEEEGSRRKAEEEDWEFYVSCLPVENNCFWSHEKLQIWINV